MASMQWHRHACIAGSTHLKWSVSCSTRQVLWSHARMSWQGQFVIQISKKQLSLVFILLQTSSSLWTGTGPWTTFWVMLFRWLSLSKILYLLLPPLSQDSIWVCKAGGCLILSLWQPRIVHHPVDTQWSSLLRGWIHSFPGMGTTEMQVDPIWSFGMMCAGLHDCCHSPEHIP